MIMNGIIYDVDLNIRTFSLEIGHNLKYFYVTNSLMKKFKKYLYPGTMVTLVPLSRYYGYICI